MIGVMYIACSKGYGFNKTVFIHIDVCFKTIRGFTLAFGALLHIVIGFRVLGTIALFVFVWSIALGLNDASIPQGTISGYAIHLVHPANFASAYVQALKAQLAVDLGQQYLHKILFLKQLAKTPNGAVVWHTISEAQALQSAETTSLLRAVSLILDHSNHASSVAITL
jgi:hypothetical protein